MYRSIQDFDSGDLETGSRVCTVCTQRKYMTEFHWANGKKWRARRCKECVKLADRKRRAEGKSKKDRASHLRLTYQITEQAYGELLGTYNGKCWICPNVLEVPYVDHDHATGKVRGILCNRCNKALGLLDDSVENLQSAIKYLTKEELPLTYIPKYKTKEEISESKRKAVHEYVDKNPYAHSTRGMGGKRILPEVKRDIVDMYATGRYTQKQVATHFGVGQWSVTNAVKLARNRDNTQI